MMRIKEGRISAVTLISIDTDRYTLIIIDGLDSFFVIYILFLIVSTSCSVTVGFCH